MTLRLESRKLESRNLESRNLGSRQFETQRTIDLCETPPSVLGDRSSSVSGPAPRSATTEQTFTVLRAFALGVVVIWHWVFATVRWDANGPHAGNPLHQVPAGFVLTWFLQVMPIFFLIGGMASLGSLDRHVSRGGSSPSWVHKRVVRLVVPVLPLLVALLAAKQFASPWQFGVILLAASPLWFLGVYVPLTLLTPTLRTLHRRYPIQTIGLSFGAVIAIQYARFALNHDGLGIAITSFIVVWGTVYQLGFFLRELVRNRRAAVLAILVGVLGLTSGPVFGYSLSMVTTAIDRRSNMGPPTSQIVFLALFQSGLIGVCFSRISALAARARIESATRWVDARQMTIYAIHLPIWVAMMIAFRYTPFAIASAPTVGWCVTRVFWLVGPTAVLLILVRGHLRTQQADSNHTRGGS